MGEELQGSFLRARLHEIVDALELKNLRLVYSFVIGLIK